MMKKRETIIPTGNDISWGTHFCHFYQTQQDLYDLVIPYLKTGLKNNQVCLWITAEALTLETWNTLRQVIPDLDRHQAAGAIEILSYAQWYFDSDTFDPQRVIGRWNMKLDQALAGGYTGLRAVTDEAWLAKPYWKAFSEYEQELDRAIAGQPVLILCAYPLATSAASAKLNILHNQIEQAVAGRIKELEAENAALRSEITERQQAREECQAYLRSLESSDRRLEEAQRLAHIGSWELDLRTNELTWTNEIYRMFDLDSQAFAATYQAFLDAIHPDDRDMVNQVYAASLENKMPYKVEHRLLMKDGSIKYVQERCKTWYDEEGRPTHSIGTVQDITERKQAERDIALLNFTLDNVQEAAYLIGEDAHFHYVNEAACRALGYSRHELLGMNVVDVDPEFPAARWPDHWDELRSHGSLTFESSHSTRDGRVIPVEINANYLEFDGQNYNLALVHDITERRQAEEERQTHLQYLENMDQVNRAIQGTSNLEQMMSNVLDAVLAIFDCDRAFLLHPCDPESASWSVPMERNKPEYPGAFAAGIVIPTEEEAADAFSILLSFDGPVKFGPGSVYPLPATISERFGFKAFMAMAIYPKVGKPWQFGIHQCSYPRLWTEREEKLFQEIGWRLADALTSLLILRDLRESEYRLEEAQRIAHTGYWERNIAADQIILSDEAYRIFGLPLHKHFPTLAQWHTQWLEMLHPEDRSRMIQAADEVLNSGPNYDAEYRLIQPGGQVRIVYSHGVITRDEEGRPQRIFGTVQDITERKQAEEALRRRLRELEALNRISTALRTAQTVEEALPILLAETLEALETEAGVIWMHHPLEDELRAAVACGWFAQLHEAPLKPGEGIAGKVFASGQAHHSIEFIHEPCISIAVHEQVPSGWGGACVPIRSGAATVGVIFVSVPLPRQIEPEEMQMLESLSEMAGTALHRLHLHEEALRRVNQLQALQTVDRAITASFDMHVSLNILLEQTIAQLGVDAADILLLAPRSSMLDYAAGRGFRSRPSERSRLRLGQGYAGRSIMERGTLHAANLLKTSDAAAHIGLPADEGFVSFACTPLIAKGQVLGVLEVFLRAPLRPDDEWLNFLEILAGQAAIAIDNARAFESLQRANTELVIAYDTTIEGWSHALDLRDRETEGHTQRVTEVTLRLAQAAGMSEDELVHVRRGALLHDIGKMGVPDNILLKPGELTEEEWAVMRCHPTFAYEMLAPIAYLKPALDIPYYHHERWDGSGYPRQLKGDQIPLAARIFSVVDVWDALRSDRPYRSKWAEEKVREYIRAQSGIRFDPQMVELFFQVIL